MKRLTVLSACIGFIGSLSTISAQEFDIRGYIGINTLQINSAENTTTINGVDYNRQATGQTGLNYGVMVTYGKMFHVQAGVNFTDFQSEIVNEHPTNGTRYVDEFKISTFSIPLRVGFRLIPPDMVNIVNVRAFAGFDGHHVTGVKHTKNSGQIGAGSTDDYTNLIMNGEFGLGVDVLMFFLDVGYQFGISPVYPNADTKANYFLTNFGVRLRI